MPTAESFEKDFIVNFVECFREVEEDGVCLFVVFQAEAKVPDCSDELRFTASSLSEPMLEFIKGRMMVEMIHDAAVYNVFEKFRSYQGERNGPVVFYPSSVSFFEDSDDEGLLPGLLEATLVK